MAKDKTVTAANIKALNFKGARAYTHSAREEMITQVKELVLEIGEDADAIDFEKASRWYRDIANNPLNSTQQAAINAIEAAGELWKFAPRDNGGKTSMDNGDKTSRATPMRHTPRNKGKGIST
jgi:hypothetical protein